jgi:hypothetical protein
MEKNKLPSGTLCVVKLDGFKCSDDGYAVVGTNHGGPGSTVFRKINLSSYPSCGDFIGDTSIVNDGDVAIIIEYAGRPHRINSDPRWFNYDVYEVFIKGSIRQIFRRNLHAIR